MAENNEEIRERDPNFRKKAQWFGLAAIGLLCLTLILSVFVGGGKRRAQQRETLPIDQAKQDDTTSSQHDLQERIKKERLRRQRRNATDQGRELSPDERMDVLMERKKDQQQNQQSAPTAAPSVEQEFRQQEKRRALMARRSRFGLRTKGATQAGAKPVSGQDMTAAGFGLNASPLLTEEKRIEQEILRLESLQKQQSEAARPFELNQSRSEGHGGEQDPREKITVGRPVSEGKPKPGQKLIATGTVISAVLDQKLISDYTGPFRAMVSHDVYDVTGSYITIPKGSRVTGSSIRLSNVNEPIQARMGLTVKWLVLPNGKRISFERRVAALDQEGVPAIKDKVNYHFMAQFLGVMAYAVLSSETSREGSGWSNDQTYEGELGNSVREQFAPLAAKYLNLVPTITLRIGTPMKIFLEDDVYAFPWASLSQKLYQANRAAD